MSHDPATESPGGDRAEVSPAPGGDDSGATAHTTQDALTQSVGERLTRESHDEAVPRWKRWLGRS